MYRKTDFNPVDFEIKVYKESNIPKDFESFGFGKKTVICFELFNNGCNTDVLIGKGRNFYPIPPGQGKTFGLDGLLKWNTLCDKELKVQPSKMKVTDCNNNPLKEEKELIITYYYLIFC